MTQEREVLDLATSRLIELAASIAQGDEANLRDRLRGAIDAKVPTPWVDELLLQSALVAGSPRALSAAAQWRKAIGEPATPSEDGSDYSSWESWQQRGEVCCREVYGSSYERLRESVKALHPSFDAWMIVEAYGRTFSRPGLDLKRRELCTVAQTAVLNTPRQMHSHLRGSLNAGASEAEVEATLDLVKQYLPAGEWSAINQRWDHIRVAWSAPK